MAAAIAIDGPAGAGKSTIAKKIAQQLNMIYVDTGAMYRAIGLYFHRLGVAPEDGETIGRLAQQAEVSIAYEGGKQQVYLNGENVTAFLRTEEAGNMASAVSVYPQVRQMLVRQQQKLAAVRDVVMDGRDIGTVVLPKADVKIFLTASTRVRAERRCEDLKSRGLPCDMELVEKYIHGLFPIWGIRFIAVADNADTEIKGNKKARQINGLVNEWYLEDLSENIRLVFDMKRRQGQYIGGFPIYGYQKDPKDHNHLIIEPEAAENRSTDLPMVPGGPRQAGDRQTAQ